MKLQEEEEYGLKLVAIDLDGTLLSEDGTISAKNRQAILAVQKQGNIVAICSGRSFHDTQTILLNAGIDCPFITGNGAIAYDSNAVLQKLMIPEHVITELLQLLEAKGYYYELYTNEGVYILSKGKERLGEEIRLLKEKDLNFPSEWATKEMEIQFQQHHLHYFDHFQDLHIADLEIYKIFVLSFNRESLQYLQELLGKRQDVSLTSSGVTKLEIAHTKVSKGNALTHLANHLHIPLKDTIAIGDNLNDLSMFSVAGMSIAMGNAEDEVKQQSTYTTKNYDEDGVAYALQKYVLALQ
ncbi:Cof-type HAD-IIB family hydrolase [Heyndrickxia ginsengihumi]|uniref:Cof-type HAD-IIB family hydrolase n=1 Tax=Heyndrickxia ginsengihumi TaxID=363870 RepID=UPI0004B807CD|nr:Cof-type HAD-IIB family hydrolase [Heyndrickxia ginsengihumi]MCM3023517.1 Cof-type HAD-IIB family hydrolase [Heyndrickxia ginsengihumi]